MRNRISSLCAVVALAAATATLVKVPPALAESPQEILAAADKVRNPGQPFRLDNTLLEYRNGKPQDKAVLTVYSKEDPSTGQFRNLVRYLDPPRDSGKMLLMNGPILWFYDPASSQSVRISPQQRLLGQASDGDVLTINLAKDYTAKSMTEETIKDADRKDRTSWHLELDAANDRAIYFHVEVWIEKNTYYPVKAHFYSDSGRPLKLVYYRKYENQLGGARPTEAVIIDEVDSSLVTTMTFTNWKTVDIPDSWFQRDYLPRLNER